MLINHEKEFVYIAIPKTGTYTIHSFFNYTSGHPEPEIHHAGINEILEMHPEVEDYYAFAFVRNPWSKLVSVYNDFTLRRRFQYSEKVTMAEPLLSEFEDFTDFCLRLKDSRWFENIFFRPQIESVVRENGDPINFVGQFENINEDMEAVCRWLSIPFKPLGKENVGRYQNRNYREHYTDESRRAVEELYRQDIEEFGYEF